MIKEFDTVRDILGFENYIDKDLFNIIPESFFDDEQHVPCGFTKIVNGTYPDKMIENDVLCYLRVTFVCKDCGKKYIKEFQYLLSSLTDEES